MAETCRTAAVTCTTRAHPWGHLRSLIQIESHAVHGESPHASQEASLSGGCASYNNNNNTDKKEDINMSKTENMIHCVKCVYLIICID